MYKAQYAFNVSMIMCPAVHMATRSLLRSSSTHEPSDPLSRVNFKVFTLYSFSDINSTLTQLLMCTKSDLPRRIPLQN
jgi:hypothetical protein